MIMYQMKFRVPEEKQEMVDEWWDEFFEKLDSEDIRIDSFEGVEV